MLPLTNMLTDLHLSGFKQHLTHLELQAIEQHWSYSDFLAKLCEHELAKRYQTRIASWRKESGLNVAKSLSNIDLSRYSHEVSQTIQQLQTDADWARQAINVMLFGPSGVGKSHLANALGLKLIDEGVRVKYYTGIGLVQQLQQAKSTLMLGSFMSKLDRYRVIMIDDIGYVKKTESETSVLFEFIAHRYESGSLMITSNQPFSQWDNIFPDSMMSVAAVDRLVHHARILNIEGESYRTKQRTKG
jgi:DNA replication protein DnaC